MTSRRSRRTQMTPEARIEKLEDVNTRRKSSRELNSPPDKRESTEMERRSHSVSRSKRQSQLYKGNGKDDKPVYDAQPSKSESPQPSLAINLTQVSPSASNMSSKSVAVQESTTSPSTITPMQVTSAFVPPTSASSPDKLDSVLTMVIKPGRMTLKPTTKFKIIEALREDYEERLKLTVKERQELQGDLRRYGQQSERLEKVMVKKRKEMKTLQEKMLHNNLVLEGLENSLKESSKEEEELGQSLFVLQGVDTEPPTKKNKTKDGDSSEQYTGK